MLTARCLNYLTNTDSGSSLFRRCGAGLNNCEFKSTMCKSFWYGLNFLTIVNLWNYNMEWQWTNICDSSDVFVGSFEIVGTSFPIHWSVHKFRASTKISKYVSCSLALFQIIGRLLKYEKYTLQKRGMT